eukprot:6203773-Pleurochrysis_carterae.AAC.1
MSVYTDIEASSAELLWAVQCLYNAGSSSANSGVSKIAFQNVPAYPHQGEAFGRQNTQHVLC